MKTLKEVLLFVEQVAASIADKVDCLNISNLESATIHHPNFMGV